MKKRHLFSVIVFYLLLCNDVIISQTLYNGGYIPSNYQLDWTVAGFLSDASAIEPKHVFQVPSSTHDLTSIIAEASNFVNSTNGLAIIYFPTGTYYLTTPIELTSNNKNIIFQGDGSDKTTLVFQYMENSVCFNIHGSQSGWYAQTQTQLSQQRRADPVSYLSLLSVVASDPDRREPDWKNMVKRS